MGCARKTHRHIATEDVGELILSGGGDIDKAVIFNEQLSLLRRELAFVTGDYREILVAYYIDNRRTEDIARSLNLPKGKVVQGSAVSDKN